MSQFEGISFSALSFFMVQLLYLYMTPGKTMALTRWIFVGKVMSLLFNMLTRFFITFLPGSKCLLISWLQSLSAVTLELKKIKSINCFHFSPFYLPFVFSAVFLLHLLYPFISTLYYYEILRYLASSLHSKSSLITKMWWDRIPWSQFFNCWV